MVALAVQLQVREALDAQFASEPQVTADGAVFRWNADGWWLDGADTVQATVELRNVNVAVGDASAEFGCVRLQVGLAVRDGQLTTASATTEFEHAADARHRFAPALTDWLVSLAMARPDLLTQADGMANYLRGDRDVPQTISPWAWAIVDAADEAPEARLRCAADPLAFALGPVRDYESSFELHAVRLEDPKLVRFAGDEVELNLKNIGITWAYRPVDEPIEHDDDDDLGEVTVVFPARRGPRPTTDEVRVVCRCDRRDVYFEALRRQVLDALRVVIAERADFFSDADEAQVHAALGVPFVRSIPFHAPVVERKEATYIPFTSWSPVAGL